MFERFSRSWELVKASGEVLRQDKELLIFPLCALLASLLLAASLIGPLFLSGASHHAKQIALPGWVFFAFLFYLCQYFIVFFFNTALVGAAIIRLEGGDPTIADGFSVALSKLGSIWGYALLAATVGMVLRMIAERTGFLGRAISAVLGVAFTAATFLVVPVLVSRDVGPLDAVKESAMLLKKTWGENVIGNAGMGVIFSIFYVMVIVLGVGVIVLASTANNTALILGSMVLVVFAFIMPALVHAALQGVYAAALYCFATTGTAGSNFSGPLLQGAFKSANVPHPVGWAGGAG